MSQENVGRDPGEGAGAMLRGLRKAPSSSVVTGRPTGQPEPSPAQEPKPQPSSPTPEPAPTQVPQPDPGQGTAPTQPAAPAPSPVQPEPRAHAVEEQAQPDPPKTKREKLSYYSDADGAHRLRATHVSTQAMTGYRSLSDFVAAAVDKECARLEAAYNDGERFRTGAHAVKRGRPYDFN